MCRRPVYLHGAWDWIRQSCHRASPHCELARNTYRVERSTDCVPACHFPVIFSGLVHDSSIQSMQCSRRCRAVASHGTGYFQSDVRLWWCLAVVTESPVEASENLKIRSPCALVSYEKPILHRVWWRRGKHLPRRM